MNVKDITTMVTFVIVGILLTVTILVPITVSGLVLAGDPIELNNVRGNGLPYDYDVVDDDYVIEIVVNEGGTYSVNADGVDVLKTVSYQTLIMSDVMTAELVSTSSTTDIASIIIFGSTYVENIRITIASIGTHTISFSNGSYSVESGGSNYSGAYEWAYGIKTDGKFIVAVSTSTWYVDSINDIVMCRNDTSGSLVCSYTFHNGEVWNNGGYESTITFDTVIAEGTTNIKQVSTFAITLSNGEISEDIPIQRALVKQEVSGNESGGATYTLLEILPIFVVLGLVVALIFGSRFNRT